MDRIEIGLAIDAEERARVFGPELMAKWQELRQRMMDGYRIGYLNVDSISSIDVIDNGRVAIVVEFSISASGYAFRLMTTISHDITTVPQLLNAFLTFSRDRASRAIVEKHIDDQLWIEGPF